jgi:hypothetical protein
LPSSLTISAFALGWHLGTQVVRKAFLRSESKIPKKVGTGLRKKIMLKQKAMIPIDRIMV